MAVAPAILGMGSSLSGWSGRALIFTARSAVLESYLILHRLKPVLLKTVRASVLSLHRPFYAWDRIWGAGVGSLIFTARSAVLESYLILHRLKPGLLKTARASYFFDSISCVTCRLA